MDIRKIEKDEGQLQIHFVTKQKQNAVADTPYSIPANISVDELIVMVNTILSSSNPDHTSIEFDFLIRGEFLRQNLKHFLREREVSFEDIIEIEYVERYPPPTPDNCLLHDDWVSAVQAQGKWILTGCYDSTLCIWNNKGEHKLTIPGHEAPVKDVTWISLDAKTGIFASASQDQTVMLWEWNVAMNSVECVQVCKGHERGVDCVDVSTDKTHIASGSWDTMLKVWSTALHEADGSEAKRAKAMAATRTPQLTLEGHREAISAVKWLDDHTILTASWDHTMKLWDLKLGGIKNEIVGNKSFFDADYSSLNRLIVTASPDKNIRMYDPRSNQGTIVKNTYLGHCQWVQCVQWSKDDEYLFISGSYDNTVKLWDHRSPKAPLYDLTGHEDKILCCDWSNTKYMMSGGSDNSLRIFKSNKYVKESSEE